VERALAEASERRRINRMQAELELERERMSSVVESIPDMLWSVDLHTERILYVSHAVKRIFGRDATEFLANQRLWLEVVHPEDAPRVKAAWRQLQGGEPFEIIYRVLNADGSLRWIDNRGKPIRVAGGSLQRAEGLVRDITEQTEQRSRIERLSHVRDFSSRINAALVRLRNRDELLREVCRIAVDVGKMRGAFLGLLEPATKDVIWRAQHPEAHDRGLPELPPISARDDESGSGLVGQALKSRVPAIENEVATSELVRHRDRFLAHGVRGMAAFPLVFDGAAAGVLLLYATESGFFDHDETDLLNELAANVAFALELLDKQDRIAYLGMHDVLTGLANQTLFRDRLAEHARGAHPERDRFAACIVDVDRFKVINDTLGRQAGDSLLTQIARRLVQAVGDSGWVGRVGADRFGFIIPDVRSDNDAARRLSQRLSACFGVPFALAESELRLSGKAGLALFPADGHNQEALFANAEAACKRAKQTGDPYLFYTQRMTEAVAGNLQMESKLRLALERGEFVLHYQPKVEISTRQLTGLEALIRWQSPEMGLVPPAQFIPLMEETGLILQVGAWALTQAVADHRDWAEQSLTAPRIAVNVSAIQLRQQDFVDVVKQALRLGVTPPGIDLEITESRLMDDIEGNIRKLEAIRTLGVGLAIDDFGTGHSSLAYLARLPVDTIKIDRSFVIRMLDDPNVMTLVSSIVSLAQSLKLKLVAEGVDSEAQAGMLERLRCQEMQGYLFSKPMPKSELIQLLGKRAYVGPPIRNRSEKT
jgi:diguanylate cyclase (GGDEF)-like protein/PAS domain S-box-containing protein